MREPDLSRPLPGRSLSGRSLSGLARTGLARVSGAIGPLAVLVLLLPALQPARAADKVGRADMVINRVMGELPGTRRALKVADDVHLNEMIRTEEDATARILFQDRSDLRIGPSAQIRLSSAVFSGGSSTAVQVTRGALRFISGDGPKGSYVVRTPVATIGLRGTGIGVVLSPGRAYVTLLHGAAQVCSLSGRCSELRSPCDYVVVDRQNAAPPRRLRPGIPSFASVCQGPACGENMCAWAAFSDPTPPSRAPSEPDLPGYDPAGGGRSGGGGGAGGGGGGAGGGGRGR